jgi:hypothetical protein
VRHLVLYVTQNTPGKRDGDEFSREAVAYAKHHNTFGHEVIMLPVPGQVPAVRRPAVIEANIRQAFSRNDKEKFDVFAFFGHGTERWIQSGHTTLKIHSLAQVLSEILSPCPIIWLAACKTGAHDTRTAGKISRGFLEELVFQLYTSGFSTIGWGHTTAGHTTRNPFLALVVNDVYETVTREERKELQKALWDQHSTLRFEVPLCSTIRSLLDRIKK